MKIFPSLPEEPQLSDVYRRFPHTLPPLLDYHDRLMCDPSPLTVGERELIASYVSGLNACTFCHGAHKVAAVTPPRLVATRTAAAAAMDACSRPGVLRARRIRAAADSPFLRSPGSRPGRGRVRSSA